MRFILRLLLFLYSNYRLRKFFPQGPFLVIALGRFFWDPLSEDEPGVFFSFLVFVIVNVLNFHLLLRIGSFIRKKFFVIVGKF